MDRLRRWARGVNLCDYRAYLSSCDSPLEGAVSSEPVSIVEFPSRINAQEAGKKAKQPYASNPRNNRCAAGKAAASKALDVIPS